MIEFKNVSLNLSGKVILNNISFRIEKGQSVLLAGNSGVGKSTILKLILGLIKPTEGSIRVFGQEVSHLPEKKLLKIRQKCGMVFQEGALFDSLTIEENVGFFLRENKKLTAEQVHHKVVEILDYLGLEKYLHYYPSQLSGGMKKRVAIARAIIANPSILLYDEPTAGLDPISANRVVELIDDLRKRLNVTSMIVSHEIHYFLDVIDRMIILKEGGIFYDGMPQLNLISQPPKLNLKNKINKEERLYGVV